ncbi:MAG: FAD-dependent oxidoreductase [Dehalococcoidia bacterium]|nr:FAD-dependent oxidoreductase [Dehalococcoidia bacterium]
MSSEFKYLFSPIKIGKKTAKNRVISPAHFTIYGSGLTGVSPYERPSDPSDDRYAAFLEEKARGGCGTIVSKTCGVGKLGQEGNMEYQVPRPERLTEACKRLSEACHRHGSLFLLQLGAYGMAMGDFCAAYPRPSFGFSASPDMTGLEIPHVMEIEEIEEHIESYVVGSRAGNKGGVDGIELHISEGTLIQQSLSKTSNQRQDKYGEQLAFLTEIVNRVRAEIGPDMILALKLIADEMFPKELGGLSNEDMADIARRIDQLGKVDLITTAHGKGLSDIYMNIQPFYIPFGAWLPLDAQIKRAVKNIVVGATGRIVNPVQAEKALADGLVDMVGLVRAQIADPHWARKAMEGRAEDIKTCIGCLQGCGERVAHDKPITCLQNPACGREYEFGGTIEPCLDRAREKKKVVVVGGGPGGMEAARVAAERGHSVTLYEKDKELGGQINLFFKVPARGEFEEVIRYRNTQLKKLKVRVLLGEEATAEKILAENADAVIIATGSLPMAPRMPGIDQPNVISCADALAGTKPVGNRVVVYDMELRQKAACAAEWLAGQGKKVEIVTPAPSPGILAGHMHQGLLKQRLWGNPNITITSNTKVTGISGKTLNVIHVHSFKPGTIENVDTFVYCTYNRSEDKLYKELKGKVKQLVLIGDAWGPRSSMHAIHDAFFHVREI